MQSVSTVDQIWELTLTAKPLVSIVNDAPKDGVVSVSGGATWGDILIGAGQDFNGRVIFDQIC